VKTTRRRPRRQDAPPSVASLEGKGTLDAFAWVIRAAKSPYGPRPRMGQVEYAQAAICVIYPHGLPKNYSPSKLTRDVREQLAKDPEYCAVGFSKPVSRQTVLRAVVLLRAANEPN
jgi:hypothetical protein